MADCRSATLRDRQGRSDVLTQEVVDKQVTFVNWASAAGSRERAAGSKRESMPRKRDIKDEERGRICGGQREWSTSLGLISWGPYLK